MKRLIVFPVVGPVLGLSAVCLVSVMKGHSDFHDIYIPLGFFVVLAIVGLVVDAAMSRTPASFRVLLTAMSGAAVCAAMLVIAEEPVTAMPIVMIICVACMGFCSWLSGNPRARVTA